MIRTYIELGLIVLSTGAGWFAWDQFTDRLRAEGQLELLLASRDSAAMVAAAAVREVQEIDVAAQERVELAEGRAAEAEQRAQEAEARAPEIIERRVAVAADTAATRAALLELQANHELEREEWLEQRAALLVVQEVQSEQLLARDRAIRDLNVALEAALAIDRINTAPGFFETWGGRALAASVGAGIGYAVGKGT